MTAPDCSHSCLAARPSLCSHTSQYPADNRGLVVEDVANLEPAEILWKRILLGRRFDASIDPLPATATAPTANDQALSGLCGS